MILVGSGCGWQDSHMRLSQPAVIEQAKYHFPGDRTAAVCMHFSFPTVSLSAAVLCALAGACAGLFGSLLDSLLGATVQFTGYNRSTGRVTSRYSSDVVPISGIPLLSNSAVNVISATATAALCSWSLAYVL